MTLAAQKLLAAYVDSEFAIEWQRKVSIEARAFGIITANLAVLTLLIAGDAQFKFTERSEPRAVHTAMALVIVFQGLSVASAILTALPWNYPGVEAARLKSTLESIEQGQIDESSIQFEIVEARISQFAAASRSNAIRMNVCLFSFASLGLSGIALIFAFVAD